MNLNKCLISIANGDYSSFDNLYNQTKQGVFHIILSYTNNNFQLAEDIMQDTYITVCKKANLYKPDTNAIGWIITIAKNTALNYYQKQTRRQVFDIDSMPDIKANDDDIPHDSPLLDLAFKVLSSQEYQILMLTEIDGYKRREVAEMLNMPIGTVTWLRNQAIKKLEKEWSKI